MRYKLEFTEDGDGHLSVMMEMLETSTARQKSSFTTTKFNDENLFLYHVVLAELDDETTTSIVANVLLATADVDKRSNPVFIECSERQLQVLGLPLPSTSNATEAIHAGTF